VFVGANNTFYNSSTICLQHHLDTGLDTTIDADNSRNDTSTYSAETRPCLLIYIKLLNLYNDNINIANFIYIYFFILLFFYCFVLLKFYYLLYFYTCVYL